MIFYEDSRYIKIFSGSLVLEEEQGAKVSQILA